MDTAKNIAYGTLSFGPIHALTVISISGQRNIPFAKKSWEGYPVEDFKTYLRYFEIEKYAALPLYH